MAQSLLYQLCVTSRSPVVNDLSRHLIKWQFFFLLMLGCDNSKSYNKPSPNRGNYLNRNIVFRSKMVVTSAISLRQVLNHSGVQLRLYLRLGGIPDQCATVLIGRLLLAGKGWLDARSVDAATCKLYNRIDSNHIRITLSNGRLTAIPLLGFDCPTSVRESLLAVCSKRRFCTVLFLTYSYLK